MSISIPSVFVRRWYARAFANGEAFDYASLDSQHADLVETANLLTQRLNLISTVNGTLITLDSTSSFVATSSQTAFTVPSYNTSTDTVHVYLSGVRLAAASITKTNSTTVTIPAQPVSTPVQIDVFTPGNGTTALASTSVNQGASLVGINDIGGLLTATNVETALQEIATNLVSAAYLGGVLTISNYIKKDGSVTFTGDQSMGTKKLTNLGAGIAGSNDAARMADITSAALAATLTAYLSATFLPLSGGTMSGNISMGGGNKVTGLAAATATGQAVRWDEFQAINASQITAGSLAAARMTVMVGDAGAGGVQGAVPAPAAGDAVALKFLRADALWAVPPSNPGAFIQLRYQVASGVGSGANTGGSAWTTRPLNVEVVDTGNNCVLAANQFTLEPGTYRMNALASFFQVDKCKLRLRQTSGTPQTVLVGFPQNIDNNDDDSRNVPLTGRFTIAVATTYELQYAADLVGNMGIAYAASGEIEIYADVILIKE